MDYIYYLELALRLATGETEKLQQEFHQTKSKPPFVSSWGAPLDPKLTLEIMEKVDKLIPAIAQTLVAGHRLKAIIANEKAIQISESKKPIE